MTEDTLFERTPLERLLALKAFLDAELGHRVHLLTRTREEFDRAVQMNDTPAAGRIERKIPYWARAVKECNDRIQDVESLIEWHDCEAKPTGGAA